MRVEVLAITPTHQDCRQSVGGASTIHPPTYPSVVADRPALGSVAGNEDANGKPWWRLTDILGRPIARRQSPLFEHRRT